MSFWWGVLLGVGVAHFIYTINDSVKMLDEWMQGYHD